MREFSEKVEDMQKVIEDKIKYLHENETPVSAQVEFYKVTMDTLYYLIHELYDLQQTVDAINQGPL